MSTLRALSVAMVLLVAERAEAATQVARGPLGLGLMFGLPAGPTGKFFFTAPSALQLHFGYGWSKVQQVVVVADYLYHFHDVVDATPTVRTSLYVGGGMHLGISSDATVFGVRFPVGLSFQLSSAQIEFFVEIVPGLSLNDPRSVFALDGGVGARWFF